MDKISYPSAVDFQEYAPGINNPRVLYGLPQDIAFCSCCVYSNQKPTSAAEFNHTAKTTKETVHFDEQGVCQACRTVARKRKIDWDDRERELRELCDRFRSKDGSFDCLVPGSGGKDSIFAAHILKYKYNMHPLTVTFAPHMYTDWGWKNFNSWIGAGFDNYLFSANRRVQRLLTRLALENIYHPFQPFMMGQMYYPSKMALRHNIKLVFYGENPNEYGNRVVKEQPTKELEYFTRSGSEDDLFIGGVSKTDLIGQFGLSAADLDAYMPPTADRLLSSGTEVHFLGYYLKWHPQACYYYAAEHAGFQPSPERTAGTYSKYSSIDDKLDDFHYYTTFIKFGIGRAVHDAAQEVRAGDIDRDEAVALARRYDGEFPERFCEEILAYLSLPAREYPVASTMFEQPIMDRTYFDLLTDRFRSPHLWKREDGAWKLRKTVFDAF